MFSIFLKKTAFFLLIFLFVLVAGGLGGLLVDRYALPYLTSLSSFSRLGFLKKATEHVTIINKTEEIIIREDDTVEKIASQAATAVVNILVLGGDKKAGETLTDVTVPSPRVETVTGLLLTNDGLLATYSEVPFDDPAAQYIILLYDGTSHQADFLGQDRYANLNFFRLRDTLNTPAIALANSDDTRVGRRLIAIGNTFAEYQNRLSVGILSNIDRVFNLSGKTVASSEKLEGVFEMDLESPEKYVGGPVIGFNGEMIGLVGALKIDNRLRPFLIPANVVRESLDRALTGRLTSRANLGIYYLPITKAYALGQNLSRDRGALIYSSSGSTGLAVIAGSPAERAGLRAGDIITAVNGREVNLETPLSELLSRMNAGEAVEFLVVRDGKERTFTVIL